MAMKSLAHLRGITDADVRRLRARGIQHSNQLLHACTLGIDRATISRRTGISPDRLLEFAHQCALLEVSSLDRWLAVVRRLGVTDLKVLRTQEPAQLHHRIVEAVGLGGAPTLSMVEYWVSQARSIDLIEEEERDSVLDVSPSLRPDPGNPNIVRV
jgi:hypothetical protein